MARSLLNVNKYNCTYYNYKIKFKILFEIVWKYFFFFCIKSITCVLKSKFHTCICRVMVNLIHGLSHNDNISLSFFFENIDLFK